MHAEVWAKREGALGHYQPQHTGVQCYVPSHTASRLTTTHATPPDAPPATSRRPTSLCMCGSRCWLTASNTAKFVAEYGTLGEEGEGVVVVAVAALQVNQCKRVNKINRLIQLYDSKSTHWEVKWQGGG